MSLVTYSLKESQTEGERVIGKTLLDKLILDAKEVSKSNGNTKPEDKTKPPSSKHQKVETPKVLVDFESSNEFENVCKLIGMLENLKKLSVIAQTTIINITGEADKLSNRVCTIHDNYQSLRNRVDNISGLYGSDKFKLLQENTTPPQVSAINYETEQGRFNSNSMSDGW